MELEWWAPVRGQSGWEVLSRGLLCALDKLGVGIKLNAKDDWNMERCLIDNEDASRLRRMIRNRARRPIAQVFHQWIAPTEFAGIRSDVPSRFVYSLFETDSCPTPWVDSFQRAKADVWVFSDFNKQTYERSGVERVKVMPFGVDCDRFNPSVEPMLIKNRKGFAFITNGDFTERKNFEGLIEAYVTEFTGSEDVSLIIKAHYGGFVRRYRTDVERRFKDIVKRFNATNPPQILLLGDKLPENELPRFYRGGDCFVLASRGEGLGLPYAEALASGVPVIAAKFGGQMQFLNEDNSYLVDCDVKQIDDMEYIRKSLWSLNHKWAHPNIDQLRKRMRFAFEFRDTVKQKGMAGRALMETMTWQKAALWCINECIAPIKSGEPVTA